MSGENFSLTQRNILHLLRRDVNFFTSCVTGAAVDVSAAYYCHLDVSQTRLLEVWDFWNGDVRRTSIMGFSQIDRATLEDYNAADVELDHFKQAAFLSFWIRRLSPIIAVNEIADPNIEHKRQQGRFFAFANEILAFNVAIQLCGYYEQQRWEGQGIARLPRSPIDVFAGRISSWQVMRDFVMIMRHKNMSPHALYLIFKTMFLL